MFAVMNDKGEIVALTDSPAKAYAAALNTDNESLHIVRETRTEEAVTYDYYTGSLFGDYNENDLYDEAGSLKQEVKDAVIKEIEQAFKIESKADIPPSNSPEAPDGSKQPSAQKPQAERELKNKVGQGSKQVVDNNTPNRIPVIGIGDLHGENPEQLKSDLIKVLS